MEGEPKVTLELALRHGLTPEEYERAKSLVGRELTYTELGVISVMWSEHVSYKTSKVYLEKYFGLDKQAHNNPGVKIVGH